MRVDSKDRLYKIDTNLKTSGSVNLFNLLNPLTTS